MTALSSEQILTKFMHHIYSLTAASNNGFFLNSQITSLCPQREGSTSAHDMKRTGVLVTKFAKILFCGVA